jgi:hypothetical protein
MRGVGTCSMLSVLTSVRTLARIVSGIVACVLGLAVWVIAVGPSLALSHIVVASVKRG